jgi:hypothetical protein
MNSKNRSLVIGLAVGALVMMVGLTGRGQADIRTQDLVAELPPIGDTSIFSEAPLWPPHSDAKWLWVGDGGSFFGEERALIQFSFSTVPVSVTIQQALLWLSLDQQATGYSPEPLSISIHRVTQPWAETATWNQMADKFAESYATVTVGHTSACAFDITGLVRAWRAYDATNGASGYQNYGLMVKATSFVPGIQKIFFSREAPTAPEPIPGAKGPILQIYSGSAPAPTPTATLPPLPNRLFMPLVSRAATCP